jgi:hypothetical protein
MTDLPKRPCPRCGTALVEGSKLCPGCGLNVDEAPVDALGRSLEGAPASTPPADPPSAPPVPAVSATSPAPFQRVADRVSPGIATVIIALAITSVLVIFDVGTRPQPAGSSAQPGGSQVAPSAAIVGMTILSPRDGDVVASKEVTVIGLAPPGLTITRDVSFGFDSHASVDGTGHWAINVGLEEGQNDLVFRIGDDRSTEQRVRVIYTPQAP